MFYVSSYVAPNVMFNSTFITVKLVSVTSKKSTITNCECITYLNKIMYVILGGQYATTFLT
jgi:hypothetical protein